MKCTNQPSSVLNSWSPAQEASSRPLRIRQSGDRPPAVDEKMSKTLTLALTRIIKYRSTHEINYKSLRRLNTHPCSPISRSMSGATLLPLAWVITWIGPAIHGAFYGKAQKNGSSSHSQPWVDHSSDALMNSCRGSLASPSLSRLVRRPFNLYWCNIYSRMLLAARRTHSPIRHHPWTIRIPASSTWFSVNHGSLACFLCIFLHHGNGIRCTVAPVWDLVVCD